MRTNNAKVKNTIISVYFILIVISITFLIVFKIMSNESAGAWLLMAGLAVFFVLLLVLMHHVSKFFEYDSDGMKVVVANRGLLFADKFNYREHLIEFEKHQLYAYKFRNIIFYKTLTFYLKNSRGKKYKETFNITLVTSKKRRYMRQSLSKMVKANIKSSTD
ncbi:hypothetical protein [Psychroserpens sp.]|uniref:hypothetical protein n=1 Tax=Psychroserpens sp. TaxID=2020870 RepID=UPI003C7817AF